MEEPKGNEIVIEDLVRVKGLTEATHLNGRLGVVDSDLRDDGRLAVTLFPKSEKTVVCIKPINLEKIQRTLPKQAFLPKKDSAECPNCGYFFKSRDLLECSKCLLVAYCSIKCQKLHWKKEHKHQCQEFRQQRKQMRVFSSNQTQQERTDVLIMLSTRLVEKEDYVAAESILREGIEQLPPHEFGLQLKCFLGLVLSYQGCIDEAVEITQRAVYTHDITIEVDDLGPIDYQNLGALLERQGDYEQAIKAFEKLLTLVPGWTSVLYPMGRMNMALGNFLEAEEAYCKFVQEEGPFEDPTHALAGKAGIAYCHLAVIRERRLISSLQQQQCPLEAIQKEREELIALLQKALLLDPALQDLYQKRIELHLQALKVAKEASIENSSKTLISDSTARNEETA